MRHYQPDATVAELQEAAAAPQKIPVFEGPLHGARPGKSADGKTDRVWYGATSVPAHEAKTYEAARDYLAAGKPAPGIGLRKGDPVMRSHFLFIEDGHGYDGSTFTTDICIHDKGYSSSVDLAKLSTTERLATVDWFPRHALMTEDGKGVSPALALGHELTHLHHYALDPWAFSLRSLTPIHAHSNYEEMLTITRENMAARILGDGQRHGHWGFHYRVNGPTDRESPNAAALSAIVRHQQALYTSGNWWSHRKVYAEIATDESPAWRAYARAQRETSAQMFKQLFTDIAGHRPLSDHLRYAINYWMLT